MAKRKPRKASRPARPARKTTSAGRSAKRPTAKKSSGKKRAAVKKTPPRAKVQLKKRAAAPARPAARKAKAPAPPARKTRKPEKVAVKTPRLDRARRTLDETVQGPPSSLDLDQRGSAARTGRAEYAGKLRDHRGMSGVTGGDPDVDIEDAYFTGEEAPGGDNPTPDQDLVDDIGKALGVEYEDNEELKASDKVGERDKHRWELDPASAEDYRDRD
jgi:hypothetical protein